jgi:hypothetical protein
MESVGWDMLNTKMRKEQEEEFYKEQEERENTVWTWLYRNSGSDVCIKTNKKFSDEQEVRNYLSSIAGDCLSIRDFVIVGKLENTARKIKRKENTGKRGRGKEVMCPSCKQWIYVHEETYQCSYCCVKIEDLSISEDILDDGESRRWRCGHEGLLGKGKVDGDALCGEKGLPEVKFSIRMSQYDWQPIETAPRDGTRILAYQKDYLVVIVSFSDYVEMGGWDPEGFKNEGGWADDDTYWKPDYWMPLPEMLEEDQ